MTSFHRLNLGIPVHHDFFFLIGANSNNAPNLKSVFTRIGRTFVFAFMIITCIVSVPVTATENNTSVTQSAPTSISTTTTVSNILGNRQIAFVQLHDNHSRIFVMDIDNDGHGYNASLLTGTANTGTYSEDYPSWSPDGTMLSFTMTNSNGSGALQHPLPGSSS